jgi:hypothetical protein
MKIVKRGRLPVSCYRGDCHLCGCVVECSAAEARTNRNILSCPTPGCSGKIHVYMTSQPYEDDEPYVNPWMPKPLPKPYTKPYGEPKWSLQSPPVTKPMLVVKSNKLFDSVHVQLGDGRMMAHRFDLN